MFKEFILEIGNMRANQRQTYRRENRVRFQCELRLTGERENSNVRKKNYTFYVHFQIVTTPKIAYVHNQIMMRHCVHFNLINEHKRCNYL